MWMMLIFTIYSRISKPAYCHSFFMFEILSWCHNAIKISADIFPVSAYSKNEYKRMICHSEYKLCLKYTTFGNVQQSLAFEIYCEDDLNYAWLLFMWNGLYVRQ